MIPITVLAIGRELPEQSLSPLSSGIGFTCRGEPRRQLLQRSATTLGDCRSRYGVSNDTFQCCQLAIVNFKKTCSAKVKLCDPL